MIRKESHSTLRNLQHKHEKSVKQVCGPGFNSKTNRKKQAIK